MWMVAVPYLLSQLKANHTQEMAPLGMESKHITHDYEKEGIGWSGSMEVDAPYIIHWHNLYW